MCIGVSPSREEDGRERQLVDCASPLALSVSAGLWGAHPSRVLVPASRRDELCEGSPPVEMDADAGTALEKFVLAGRQNQHAGRMCSPAQDDAAPATGSGGFPAAGQSSSLEGRAAFAEAAPRRAAGKPPLPVSPRAPPVRKHSVHVCLWPVKSLAQPLRVLFRTSGPREWPSEGWIMDESGAAAPPPVFFILPPSSFCLILPRP